MTEPENEYEVESVTGARVEKKRGKKLIWKYCVKWKGYGSDDDTWEPVESFEGSEHILEQFWERATTDGRDTNRLNLFKAGEEFYPVGPPRRKRKRKSLLTGDAVADAVSPEDETTKEAEQGHRPAKRTRKRVSETHPSPEAPKQSSSPSRSRRNKLALNSPPKRRASSPQLSTRRKKKANRDPSPDVPPSEESENEVMLDYLAGSSSENPFSSNTPPKTHSNDPPPDPTTVKDAAEDDTREPITAASPLFDDDDDDEQDAAAESRPSTENLLPSHRVRAANPLVKMADDPELHGLDGAISVKARLLARNMATFPSSPTAGPSESLSNGESSRTSVSRAGPGRSSKGLQKKNTSSLLTFQKGGLKTVKGKYTSSAQKHVNETLDRPDNDRGDGRGGGGAPTGNEGPHTTLTSGSSDQGELQAASALPNTLPTGQELLQLAGLDSHDIEALPDFEDDAPAEQNLPLDNSNSVLQQSLALAKDKLFPAGLSTASVTEAVSAAWRRSTIFGPLGLGSEASAAPALEARSELAPSSPFFLTLDSSVSVPVGLISVSPSQAGSPSLDFILGKVPKGPPGKFYHGQFSLALLDTLRTGGPSARVVPDADANDQQKSHFKRFQGRLDAGELFVAMAGVEVLAFCSSENALLTQRLNLPLVLLGLSGSVLVSRVVIENYSAYADAALQADNVRW